MRLILCYVCPPLAVLSCREYLGFIFALILWIWPFSSSKSYALMVVNNYFQDRRFLKLTGGQAKLQLPEKSKRVKEPKPEAIDDPSIGMGGTVFRRR